MQRKEILGEFEYYANIEEGREKAKIEIAKALRDSGVDGDVIYKTTGIKPENL